MKRIYNLKGSATIEMAYIMPLMFSIFIVIIYLTFYYHDKGIINGAAYETAVLGSELVRTEEEKIKAKLKPYFNKRIHKKLILFADATASIEVTDNEITVIAKASKSRMALKAEKRAKITKPEEQIRDIRKAKNILKKGERKVTQ